MRGAAILALAALCATAGAGADDDYEGSEQPQLPKRGELKSVRGLHKYIRARVPGHTAAGVVDGMSAPLTRTKKHGQMQFLKFDTHKAVSVDAFRDSVKQHEGNILASPLRPGLTGLDKAQTMTSRSDRYNVFFWEEPWVGDYFWLIKRAFHEYIEAFPEVKEKITKPMFIHSWANCLRKGQKLEWHNHAEEDDFQISGTFAVSTPEGSATLYQVPSTDKVVRNPNTAHDLVMFDSMIMHQSVAPNEAQLKGLLDSAGSECRITSSWDINEEPGTVWHSVPFYDPDDPYFTKDPTGTNVVKVGQEVLRTDRTEEEIEAFQKNPKAQSTRWGPILYGTLEEAKKRGPFQGNQEEEDPAYAAGEGPGAEDQGGAEEDYDEERDPDEEEHGEL